MSSAAAICMVGVDHWRPAKHYDLRLQLRASKAFTYPIIEILWTLDPISDSIDLSSRCSHVFLSRASCGGPCKYINEPSPSRLLWL